MARNIIRSQQLEGGRDWRMLWCRRERLGFVDIIESGWVHRGRVCRFVNC